MKIFRDFFGILGLPTCLQSLDSTWGLFAVSTELKWILDDLLTSVSTLLTLFLFLLSAMPNNWRVRWKKGVRYFTQNRTLSKTLQISHAVLFRCLKQCSACFSPWSLLPFWDITYAKNTFFRGHPLRTFCWMKNKRTFCFAKRWSHYNALIIHYCFVSASG